MNRQNSAVPVAVSPQRTYNRVIALDVLRGIAILLVLFRHSFIIPHYAGFCEGVATVLFRFGWTGVDLFFVLSGFLVGGILLRELQKQSSINVHRFLVRRAFKIWPGYYFFLVVTYLMHRWKYQIHPPWEFRYYALGVQNYLAQYPGHLWSLAVEEHFYLVLPVFLLFLARKDNLRHLPRVTVGVLIAGVLMRVATRWLHPVYSHETHSFPTHLRIDSLLVGVAIAYLYYCKPDALRWIYRARLKAAVIGSLLVSPMLILNLEQDAVVPIVGFPMLAIGYALILLSVMPEPGMSSKSPSWLTKAPCRVVAHIGFYSYPIYLWHLHLAEPVAKYLAESLRIHSAGIHWLVAMALFISFSTCFGILLSRAIEIPALRLRDRYFPDVSAGRSKAS